MIVFPCSFDNSNNNDNNNNDGSKSKSIFCICAVNIIDLRPLLMHRLRQIVCYAWRRLSFYLCIYMCIYIYFGCRASQKLYIHTYYVEQSPSYILVHLSHSLRIGWSIGPWSTCWTLLPSFFSCFLFLTFTFLCMLIKSYCTTNTTFLTPQTLPILTFPHLLFLTSIT